MAMERIPWGKEWEEICNIEDEETQSRRLREYVCDLQDQIMELKSSQIELEQIRKDGINLLLNIVKSNFFEYYMKNYDVRFEKYFSQDWSGLQEGF